MMSRNLNFFLFTLLCFFVAPAVFVLENSIVPQQSDSHVDFGEFFAFSVCTSNLMHDWQWYSKTN